jgi:hypothetical protein
MKTGFLMSIGIMRMNIFGFQMAVKNFLKRSTINFLNYALILRRSVNDRRLKVCEIVISSEWVIKNLTTI